MCNNNNNNNNNKDNNDHDNNVLYSALFTCNAQNLFLNMYLCIMVKYVVIVLMKKTTAILNFRFVLTMSSGHHILTRCQASTLSRTRIELYIADGQTVDPLEIAPQRQEEYTITCNC